MEQKILLVLGVALLSATAGFLYQATQDTVLLQDQLLFTAWSQDFGRIYSSQEEATYRFGIFRSNLQFVAQHNELYQAGEESIELGLNDFADLTNEEYIQKFLTLKTLPKSNNRVFTGLGYPISNDVDWTTKGAVTPVKNQGQCGSCWAFSTTGSVEGRVFQRDGTLPSLSEQELVDCAGGNYGNEGCNGGLMDLAFQYIIDNGITTEANYGYTGQDGTCKANVQPRYHISGFTDVKNQSRSAFEAAVTQQPVSVAIDASSIFFQFYRSGVFKRTCSVNLNHGVLAVGLGTDGSDAYIKVKNSWGTTWGASGFINMARLNDGHGQCGIYDSASFPN